MLPWANLPTNKLYSKFLQLELMVLGYVGQKLVGLEILGPPGRGGTPRKNWWGCAARFLKRFTLFMTKMCDFPHPIYDQTKNLIP